MEKIITKNELFEILANKFIYNLSNISEEAQYIYLFELERIINELYELNKISIEGLSAKETFALRKLYGILNNGIVQSKKNVAKSLNLTHDRTLKILKSAHKIINKRIINKYQNKDNLRTNEMMTSLDLDSSKSHLRKKTIGELELSVRIDNSLSHQGINTIEQLLSMSIDEIKSLKDIGEIAFKQIITKIHELGLVFIDELTDEEKIKIIKKSSEEKILSSSVKWIKISTKEELYIRRYNIKTLRELRNAILNGDIVDKKIIESASKIGLLDEPSETKQSLDSFEEITEEDLELKQIVKEQNELLKQYFATKRKKEALEARSKAIDEEIRIVKLQIKAVEKSKQEYYQRIKRK